MIRDPFLLLSVVNTALRDKYSSLEDYCLSEDANKDDVENLLLSIGYVYDEEDNCFKRK
ncbi:MAG: DUF4250 domain-containing protein [Clostridiales bacterium]|nr:DUF4250 domain-containing protein [Clostridiales bacterium]